MINKVKNCKIHILLLLEDKIHTISIYHTCLTFDFSWIDFNHLEVIEFNSLEPQMSPF